MALNVTTAVIGSGCNTATASPSLAQWDQGQVLKIEGVDLPAAYQVEFSTEYTRNAIQKIGNENGVAIPNELLQRSAPITAYVVLHEGENDRETEYWITIHITPRTPPETVTPDPEEQSVIDETIAALQDGVAAAQAAAESVQNMGVEAETLAPGSPLTVTKEVDPETGSVTLIFGLTQGPKGDDGYSPTITITEITGGHRFTVTDKTHPSGQSFDVLDGAKGDKGDDGYSPTITITTITGGHRFTVTDKTHPSGQSFDVLDGAKGDKGDDGYSPVVTITTITGGHRVTITDKTHPSGQTFDVMDGVIQSVNGKSAASITLDSGDIEFDDSATYAAGSIGAEVSQQKSAIGELEDALEARATALNALVLKLLYVDPDVYSNEYKDFCTAYGIPWVDPDTPSTKDEWYDGRAYQLDAIDGEYYQASNGQVKTYTGWSRTDYVICNGASSISFPPMPQQSGTTVNSCAWFDQNKAFVSNLPLSKTDTVVRNVPQNAYYFGISSETQALLDCITVGITPYA